MATHDNILIGGVAYTPSSYSRTMKKIGEAVESEAGTRRWVQVVTSGAVAVIKYEWELEFGRVTDTQRAALETLAKTAATTTLRDMNGTSFTVQFEADCYEEDFDFRAPNGTLYWNVSIKVAQA